MFDGVVVVYNVGDVACGVDGVVAFVVGVDVVGNGVDVGVGVGVGVAVRSLVAVVYC